MKKLSVFLLAFFVTSLPGNAWAASPVSIYDFQGNGVTSTTLGGGHRGLDISGTITATNPSVSATGAAVPADATYIAGINGSGNLVGLLTGQQTMANSLACVLPSDQSAIPVTGTFWQATQPVSAASLPLPTGAATSALQTQISGQLPATLGQKTSANSLACVLASDQSAVPSSQSGAWNIGNITGTVSLPTGAATAAKQPALGTAGTASSDVITVQGIASMTALNVDGSGVTQPVSGTVTANQGGTWNINNISGTVSLPTGAATSANQTTANTSLSSIATNTANIPAKGQATMANSTPVAIASDQSAVPIKAPLNSTGSGSAAAATVSTVITLTAPANAVGAFLMNIDTSTANVRWAVNRTATTTLGQQLQPGRDVWIPTSHDISLVSESGTQTYDVQWISQ